MSFSKIIQVDYLIIGAGVYGLYAGYLLQKTKPKAKVLILEYDREAFMRASYINQARVHNGYHYPRSLFTALKSAKYYQRFNEDFSFAINRSFKKIYAVATNYSYASAENFQAFCKAADIPCQEIHLKQYFRPEMIEAAFLTEEYSLDAQKIKSYLLDEISPSCQIKYNCRLKSVQHNHDYYEIELASGEIIQTPFVLNSTYASINQIIQAFQQDSLSLKYEIAEMCICTPNQNLQGVGLTVMDGPFFSVMPFGLGGDYSLSSVHFTPHLTSHQKLPTFPCQNLNPDCSALQLANCNQCHAKPASAWPQMLQLSKKYLNEDIELTYKHSLFAVKPLLKTSEIDDSRPTLLKVHTEDTPTFVSVLSGKINTIYDLQEVLLQ